MPPVKRAMRSQRHSPPQPPPFRSLPPLPARDEAIAQTRAPGGLPPLVRRTSLTPLGSTPLDAPSLVDTLARTTPTDHCSFCTKSVLEVRHLIRGPDDVRICNDCVRLCTQIVNADHQASEDEEPTLEELRPSQIHAYLDEHIIGQAVAKRALSVAVYNHYKRLRSGRARDAGDVDLTKGNVLMIGPTGSGKTLIAKTLARRLGVPFTMADATALTEAGYVGEDVESMIKNLWLDAGKDVELAGRGIICLDEVDKICRHGGTPTSARDVGGEGVQQALLKILEDQRVSINPETNRNRPQQELIQVNTRDILFLCAGAFDGLVDIIERRVRKNTIGFGTQADESEVQRAALLRQVRAEDLIHYGLIPEFVGRVPIIVTFDELSDNELVEVLWKPRNALVRQYKRLLALDGVELKFEQDALVAMVQIAKGRGAGARGLRAVLEDTMLDLMYELPSQSDVRSCIITKDVVLRQGAPQLSRKAHVAASPPSEGSDTLVHPTADRR
mgnify:CR=1 FL=1